MAENLKIVSDYSRYQAKEHIYIELRKKEGRLYSEEVLLQIPYIKANNVLAKEWKVRAASLEKLKSYLSRKNKPLEILDLGCGNGWMSNALASGGNTVTAVDLNMEELKRGAKVFEKNKNLQFIYGDIFENIVSQRTYDIIVCASSIQYFPSLASLIEGLILLLKPEGEIHIIDSPIYEESEVADARTRSRDYFINAGIQAMTEYYHHHTWKELKGFNYRINKGLMLTKFYAKINGMTQFPWIIIKAEH